MDTLRSSTTAGRRTPRAEGPGRVLAAMDRLERWSRLDSAVRVVQRAVRVLPPGPAKDLLHGRRLGHPLHPLLVQVPIGTWLSAAVLDTLPGRHGSAQALIGVGLAAAAPAAMAGWADWAESQRPQMRVGLVHAAANVTAVVLYAASFLARARGRTAPGKVLGFTGLGVVGIGGAIGGHLAYRQASGANHAEAVPHLVPDGWQDIGDLAGLLVGHPVRRHLGDVPVLVVREQDDTVRVLADTCSHLGGPLSQGTLSDGCVQCPWHGSRFRLDDGWNVRGPATAPQPVFDARVIGGRIQARLRQRGATRHRAA
ncbi:Rieske (2Fe-2S) protein [Streptomyces sp. LP05-1]|uniref:Rieske (2Fe-2S) protein n=1 Tax=Streptomyces pyxinae TaxID=2970734 RepID=A0ABT2CDU0_9ACTN|nr:Rieske (2Fe-2S) protein [Streptomyces sp. LP05-1]MCS0635526.1 Rieske (2Fe-2S) protein [Streptomyces sp. LP05-1]